MRSTRRRTPHVADRLRFDALRRCIQFGLSRPAKCPSLFFLGTLMAVACSRRLVSLRDDGTEFNEDGNNISAKLRGTRDREMRTVQVVLDF
jgi:hypothetical protein